MAKAPRLTAKLLPPLAAAFALTLVASGASADWWDNDGLYDNNDYYADGIYDNELAEDDWFYDSYGDNFYDDPYDYGYYPTEDYGDYYDTAYLTDDGDFDREWWDWW